MADFKVKKFPKTRIATLDITAIGQQKHHIAALIEVDVSRSKAIISKLNETGPGIVDQMPPGTLAMLETTRLTIFPLTHAQLQLYLSAGQALEKSLGLNPHQRQAPAALKKAFQQKILPVVARGGNQVFFSTLWAMVNKEKRVMVGELRFKGPPNEQGELEIGYSTYEDFRKQGYMSEALAAIVSWAFSLPEVRAIIAQTDKHNRGSHRLLQKAGFGISRESEWFYWWRLEKIRGDAGI